ncbi:hypothetical protein BDP67DRAFT_535551 [Colletotrichum lupini]|nr:hypothetical protein BDP67DRAFT_535551 [Colletotrichum lupini]
MDFWHGMAWHGSSRPVSNFAMQVTIIEYKMSNAWTNIPYRRIERTARRLLFLLRDWPPTAMHPSIRGSHRMSHPPSCPPNPRVETAMFQYAWFLEGRAPGIRPYSIEPKSLGRILVPQGTVSPSPRMQHGDAGHTLVVDSRRAMLSNLLRSVSICRRRGRTVQCTDTEHYIHSGHKAQRPNNDCCPSTQLDNQPKHNHDTHAGK